MSGELIARKYKVGQRVTDARTGVTPRRKRPVIELRNCPLRRRPV
jgi:hypothetical protein